MQTEGKNKGGMGTRLTKTLTPFVVACGKQSKTGAKEGLGWRLGLPCVLFFKLTTVHGSGRVTNEKDWDQ